MRALFLSSLSLFLFSTLLYQRVESQENRADTPPRGWNSYDSYDWIITEKDFLENAQVLATLKNHGYEYAVLDHLWYRRNVDGAGLNSQGFDVIDEWGRVIPDPERWPSSKGGKGFKEVADKVHAMGLKFGIHVMRGISTQAFTANTSILDITTGKAYQEGGLEWRAANIGLTEQACAWMDKCFMDLNNDLGASKAFVRSLYQQYADWGVDFVKLDCVFGDDYALGHIQLVSKILSELQRPILLSLSPGSINIPIYNAVDVSYIVNMYRVTPNVWDDWDTVDSESNVASFYGNYQFRGAKGLKGKSWPDLDMLPLGWLTDPDSKEGPHRSTRFSLDEQRQLMTLWCIAKSPLMFGGDLKNLDSSTLDIITHPDLLEINTYSQKNTQIKFEFIPPAHQSNKMRFLPGKNATVKEVKKTDTHALSLTSCNNHKAKGWFINESVDKKAEQVCWKYPLGSRYKPRFCLNKRKPALTVTEEAVYEQRYKEKYHLFAADEEDLCLDGSPTTKLTSNKIHNCSFSPCKWHANQLWELNLNGTLVNSYSGQCATMKRVSQKKTMKGGVKAATDINKFYSIWTAIGRRGEGYVAFFNLCLVGFEISAKIEDLAKATSQSNIGCTYREIWTKSGIVNANETLSMNIPAHATALFVLKCAPAE